MLASNIMKTIDQLAFTGKKALIRVDFNVPLDKDYNITDDNRMTAALPTIEKILKDGGAVILMSHLGRPKGGPEDKYSLKHLVPHLSDLLGQKVEFADGCIMLYYIVLHCIIIYNIMIIIDFFSL